MVGYIKKAMHTIYKKCVHKMLDLFEPPSIKYHSHFQFLGNNGFFVVRKHFQM